MAEKEKELKKTYARFSGVGKVRFNKKDGFEIDVKSKNNENYIYSKMVLHLDCGKEGLSFVQLIGGYDINEPLPIKVFGKDKDGRDDYSRQIEIKWDDRLDENIINKVASTNLITVGLEKYVDKDGKERILYKKFLSPYDAIAYIQQHLVEDSVVKVVGNLRYQEYKGETNISKTITGIYLTDAKEEDFNATFKMQILIDSDSLEEKPDEDGLITLSYYVIDYYKNAGRNIMIPHYINIDPKQFKKWDVTKKKFKPARNQVWVWGVEGKFINQVKTVDITLDDLPDDLREMVDEGLITFETAKEKAVGGNKTREVMLFANFLTKKDKNDAIVYDKQEDLYTVDDYVFASHFEEEIEQKKENKKVATTTTTVKSTTSTTKSQPASRNPFEKTKKTDEILIDENEDWFDNLDIDF